MVPAAYPRLAAKRSAEKTLFSKMDICAKSPIKADRRLAFIGDFVMRFFSDRGLFHGPVRRQCAPL